MNTLTSEDHIPPDTHNTGEFMVVSNQEELYIGYTIARESTVRENIDQIESLLNPWSIVAFYGGKIDGTGYGERISTSDDPLYYITGGGPECAQVLLVKLQFPQHPRMRHEMRNSSQIFDNFQNSTHHPTADDVARAIDEIEGYNFTVPIVEPVSVDVTVNP